MSETKEVRIYEAKPKKKPKDPTLDLLREISKKPDPSVKREESILPLDVLKENIEKQGEVWKKPKKRKNK